MSLFSQIIWNLLSFWHKARKGNIRFEIGGVKDHYFDQVKVYFGQCKKEETTTTTKKKKKKKKERLFVIEFSYPIYKASDDHSDVNI